MNAWKAVNHELIAKAISELIFEEVLSAEVSKAQYRVTLKTGVVYSFEGRKSAWGHLWVRPQSLMRHSNQQNSIDLSAGQFFIDALNDTQMNEITLSQFLEEMHNTLYSDLQIKLQKKPDCFEMSKWDGEKLQHFLPGHPKLILNKGRLGWSQTDLKRFSPEGKSSFQLRWILVRASELIGSSIRNLDVFETLRLSFRDQEEERMRMKILNHSLSLEDWKLLPVHPWQWENIISLQFASEIQKRKMLDLGEGGDYYSPQASLRTLYNSERRTGPDLKLPLSILNTSCVRGLPQRYLEFTPELSLKLEGICTNDILLKERNVSVLKESSAWGYRHPLFHQVPSAPYRYHEHLGAIWRESTQSKINSTEQAILTGALFYQDESGKNLVEAYSERSGLSLKEWMREYARHIVIPLYHLQNAHGIGIVAHGQNVVIKLKNFAPSGLILKDFHGDLRLSSARKNYHEKIFGPLAQKLPVLPPEHLIHDLVTGHFITVLRFLAGKLEDSESMLESEFYRIFSNEIKAYQTQYAHYVTPETDILTKNFQRVLVNKVRFKIGYGDSSERPLPILGSSLSNPLHQQGLS